jgi:hypothetical protein
MQQKKRQSRNIRKVEKTNYKFSKKSKSFFDSGPEFPLTGGALIFGCRGDELLDIAAVGESG